MKASAPASSANLGPGFDSLAVALDLRCEVTVSNSNRWEITDDPGGFLRSAAERVSANPLRVEVDSEIPVGRGLGSSAAVLAALELAVARLDGKPDDLHRVFQAVASAEGHPDNAAAAVYGGLVLAGPDGVHRLELHSSLSILVAVPEASLATEEARDILPATVPFAVAAEAARRAMRLVEALRTANITLLAGVGRDELHEPHRVRLRPLIGDLLEAAEGAGAPFAAISGSGPAVVAVVTAEAQEAVVRALQHAVGSGSVLNPGVSADGVR